MQITATAPYKPVARQYRPGIPSYPDFVIAQAPTFFCARIGARPFQQLSK
jgi:hypothetical protein